MSIRLDPKNSEAFEEVFVGAVGDRVALNARAWTKLRETIADPALLYQDGVCKATMLIPDKSRRIVYACTRVPDHDGPHVAHSPLGISATWTDNDPCSTGYDREF